MPSRGRPRNFDVDEALDRAMKVFWAHGYEGSSLDDLTKAMRINRPSLYAAFGDKETLFRKVLDRYAADPGAYVMAAVAQPTARLVAEHLLRGVIDQLTKAGNPRGCLLVSGAMACSADHQQLRRELSTRREAIVKAVRRRFDQARKQGDLPRKASPAELARYIATVIGGLTLQAADGATRKQLQNVARLAMKSWPA